MCLIVKSVLSCTSYFFFWIYCITNLYRYALFRKFVLLRATSRVYCIYISSYFMFSVIDLCTSNISNDSSKTLLEQMIYSSSVRFFTRDQYISTYLLMICDGKCSLSIDQFTPIVLFSNGNKKCSYILLVHSRSTN